MKYWILILLFGMFTLRLMGQDPVSSGGEIEDAQVIIEKDKDLTLPAASRIYKRTRVKSVTAEIQKLDFQITQPTYDFQSHVPNITVKSYEPSDTQKGVLVENFVRLGFGNYLSPLAQGFLGYHQDQKKVGLWVNHESFGKGPVRDEESAYGSTEVMLTGGLQNEQLSLDPKVWFQREGYYPYGYNVENQLPGFDFQDLKIGASRFSVQLPASFTPSDALTLSLTPRYQLTHMKFQDQDPFNTENQFNVNGDVNYKLSDQWKLGLQTSIQYLDYTGGLEQNRTLFEVNPTASFKAGLISGHAGLRYFSVGGTLTGSSSLLFADLGLTYQLNDDLNVFVSVEGDVEPITLTSMQMQNRYLDDSLVFQNQEVPLALKGGVELGFGGQVMFKPYIGFQQTRNKGVFIHSPQDTSRFMMVYDSGQFNQFTIGLENRVIITPKTTLMASLDYTAYNPGTLNEAWYLPAFRFQAIGYHQVGDALTLTLILEMLTGITAPEPLTMAPVTLDPIVDLGIGARYDFSKKLSGFIDFDNLFASDYQRYLNYPVRGLMVKAGISYRF